ncbi:hypothetical protein G6F59_017874 [Rhizopus arrhizus]|nr:hypothetical protein G6F59_017874 [Rhizopus arrhizus]
MSDRRCSRSAAIRAVSSEVVRPASSLLLVTPPERSSNSTICRATARRCAALAAPRYARVVAATVDTRTASSSACAAL